MELLEPQPGGFLIAEHLAHMMLVQTLRLHLSESAFSKAFKKTMGCSPRQYSRGRNTASAARGEEKAAHDNQLEPIAGW
ncbi:MAG: helix-turn-helix transcriptional regulator [Candidatus Acidiferrum sp.]